MSPADNNDFFKKNKIKRSPYSTNYDLFHIEIINQLCNFVTLIAMGMVVVCCKMTHILKFEKS